MARHFEAPGVTIQWPSHRSPCGTATGGPRSQLGAWRLDPDLATMTLGTGPVCTRCRGALKKRQARIALLIQRLEAIHA